MSPTSRVRRSLETALVVAALVSVGWFFAWTVKTAGGFESAGDADYFNLLVRGFRKGHLYLDRAPAPELAALKDPYDPAQNDRYRLADATYFQGRYYLYFGAAPAVVLLLPYAALTGHELPTGAAVFGFCLTGFLTAALLWIAIRRRYFPASAVWVAPGGVLMLGLATHVLVLARRPGMYELPIAAAYAFTMLALGATYAAIHGGRRVLALGAAGLCLGLAAASRPPSVFGAAMLLPVLWVGWREKQSGWWRGALAAGAALGACIVAMLIYNYARFGNPLEFGQNYQLTASRELSNRHFGLDYMRHNFGVYYFFPVGWSWTFPFVSARTPFASIPDYAGSEEMAGLLATLPFLWLALAAPLAWRGRPDAESRGARATVGAIGGLYLGVGIFLLAFFSTTERYAAEFAPALALLAACGWLGIERWAQSRAGRAVSNTVIAVLVGTTAVAGVLLSFDYHGRTFSRDRPEAWARLEWASHAALSRVGFALGQFDGPQVFKVRLRERPTGTVETFWRAADPRADERIAVEYVSAREIRFGYVRGSGPVRWGRRLTWEPDHIHTVELQMPSLYREPAGFMRDVRRDDEFRERTCVAVWFSGGRALGEVVEPLPTGIAPGGAVAAEFSGQARAAGSRLFRADEIEAAASRPVLTEPRGGVLRLRAVLAAPLAPEGEPLFATGALYGSDIVFVRDAGEGAVKFVFDHFNSPPRESAPVRLAPGVEHTIELTVPSCPADATFSGAATGEVTVRVDGREVLRAASACFGFAAGEEAVGRNPFGTTCAREFRGWLLEARWTGKADR